MKILYLHGWHSGPVGIKPAYLNNHGFEVINPALDDDDFDMALATAQAEFDKHQPPLVVGSSRGGAVAMNIDIGDTKLVLLCPAWKKWGTAKEVKAGTVILHSRKDDVIPFADSEALVANSHLSQELLIEVGSDHRLADDSSLSAMLWVCNILRSGEQLPSLDDESQLQLNSATNDKATLQNEASYVCDSCGEEIVIPLDLTEGSSQMYVEDCPVCCRANTIHVQFDRQGNAQVFSEPEQDYA